MLNKNIVLFLFLILLGSCVNNFGSIEDFQPTRCIEQYEYSTTPLDTMYSYIDTIYKIFPQINAYPEDSLNYTFEYDSRWYRIRSIINGIEYNLKFSFSIDPYNLEQDKKLCVISLTTGRKKGEIMKSPEMLNNEEKTLYKKLFEDEFLSKLDSTFKIQWESY
jgi:hypothetical protein